MTKKKELKDVTVLVIDRSKWLRGSSDSTLRNKRGEMCCLGFYCKATGIRPKDLLSLRSPEELERAIPGLSRSSGGDTFSNTRFAQLAMELNDDEMDELTRERALTKLFKRYKKKVKFV